jgi:hypothetical protein
MSPTESPVLSAAMDETGGTQSSLSCAKRRSLDRGRDDGFLLPTPARMLPSCASSKKNHPAADKFRAVLGAPLHN